MTVGQRIKNKRIELGISVDELSNKLGKNRATIYRYESDEIENLSITILEPLAKILNTTPGYLMGWCVEPNEQNKKISNTNDKQLDELSSYFYSLNQVGRNEAIKRIKELTLISTYSNGGEE